MTINRSRIKLLKLVFLAIALSIAIGGYYFLNNSNRRVIDNPEDSTPIVLPEPELSTVKSDQKEKMDNKLEKDKTLLLSLKDQSENYLSELKNYIIKVPKCILKIYTSELIKSRKLLTSFEEKEKQKK